MKLREHLIDYYGFLLTFIFLEWEDSVRESRLPSSTKPIIESIFVTYYKVLCDPEKEILGNTMNEISSQIDKCNIMNRLESNFDSILTNISNENDVIGEIIKALANNSTQEEFQYIIHNITKLHVAISMTECYTHKLNISNLCRDIIKQLNFYKK